MNKRTVSLNFVWLSRLKLHAEGNKLYAEGNKLYAEGDMLWAEGNKLWAEAVLEAYGNVTMEWLYREGKSSCACKVDGKDTYEP